MNSENEETVLWYLTRVILYPWGCWERWLPEKWSEWALRQKIETAYHTGKGWETLEKEAESLGTARGFGWQAQILLMKVAESYQNSKPALEASLPPDGYSLLTAAEEAISKALETEKNYSSLSLRAHIRTLLGKNSAGNQDFQEAGRLPEEKNIQKGRQLRKKAFQQWQNGQWTPARKVLRKAISLMPMERSLPVLYKVAQKFEKMQEILYLSFRTRIITIGRTRVRYLARLATLAEEVEALVAENEAIHFLEPKLGDGVREVLSIHSQELIEAIAKEKATQPSLGTFAKSLEEAIASLQRLQKK